MDKHDRRRGRRGRPADATISLDDAETTAAGHRHARLQQILREELDALVRDELSDPRLDGVRVTTVELSVDYRNARVAFWAMRPAPPSRDERDHLERALAKAAPFLRGSLADAVDLKQVPMLRFVWDQAAAERPGVHDEVADPE